MRLSRIILLIPGFLIPFTCSPAQDIFEASRTRKLVQVKELIKNQSQLVSIKDSTGRTPLHWASRGVHFEVMEFLVAKGADVNSTDNNGISPLASVASRNHIAAAKLLLEHGAKTELAEYPDRSPVFYALTPQSKGILELMIKRGASLEFRNTYQRTPLIYACREGGSLEIVKLLVDNGADINARDKFGDTPLNLAAWRGFEDIVNYLLGKNAEFSAAGEEGPLLLSYAADKRLWELYQALIRKGGEEFLRNFDKKPVLHWAAAGGSVKISEDLINRKMPVEAKDVFGWTPLHYASFFGRTDVVKLLLDKDCNMNARTPLGESAMDLARAEEKKEITSLLILNGAVQQAPVSTGLTGKFLGQKTPGSIPVLFAPGIACRLKGGHSNIAFSPDGTEAFWTEYNLRDVGYSAGCKVWHSKITNGTWALPKKILSNGDTPVYSADGNKIYFLSPQPFPPATVEARRIWFYEKTGDTLSEPRLLDFDVNATGLYWQFSIDRSGAIYYSTDQGLCRSLYRDGRFLPPEKLTEVLHPDYKGMAPYVAPEGSYIIFASDELPGGYGGLDLYAGFRNSDGTWAKPVNLGSEINTAGTDMLPMLSGDGKYLFYKSERNGVAGIYWVSADTINNLKPGSRQEAASKFEKALVLADSIIQNSKMESFKRLESFIVIKDGVKAFEKYYNGSGPDSLNHIQSQTKSIVSLLFGIAVDKGLIKSEEEPVANYFPDYFDKKDTLKSAVRIKDLLTMSAGFAWEEMIAMNDPKNDNINMFNSGDYLHYALSRAMTNRPFTVFKYISGNPMIVAAIIEKTSGMKLDEFAGKYLFGPLGIVDYRWQKDRTGFCHAGGGLRIRPSDLTKIGIMILNHGKWNNMQIISNQWLEKSFHPYFMTEFSDSRYGYFWWIKDSKINDNKMTGVFSARGAGGQYLYLVPEYNLVVSFTERNYSTPICSPWLLDNIILPALE